MTHIVNHEMHDGLRHQVTHSLVNDGHVGVDQVANGLHLPLQLRIHAVHEVVRAIFITTITLWRQIYKSYRNYKAGNVAVFCVNVLSEY